MRDQVAQIVASEHSGNWNIGIIAETSFVKKGDKTPGVQRQHCGAVGKHENCIVTVHLSFASKGFHCLLDGDLFLPESWSKDRGGVSRQRFLTKLCIDRRRILHWNSISVLSAMDFISIGSR